jgi:hypothetical protein
MIAQLKYGTGVHSRDWSEWKRRWGFHCRAATQWELVEQAAAVAKPAFDQLIWQAAQGEVLHNDDTGMRILQLARGPSDKRTGVLPAGHRADVGIEGLLEQAKPVPANLEHERLARVKTAPQGTGGT